MKLREIPNKDNWNCVSGENNHIMYIWTNYSLYFNIDHNYYLIVDTAFSEGVSCDDCVEQTSLSSWYCENAYKDGGLSSSWQALRGWMYKMSASSWSILRNPSS